MWLIIWCQMSGVTIVFHSQKTVSTLVILCRYLLLLCEISSIYWAHNNCSLKLFVLTTYLNGKIHLIFYKGYLKNQRTKQKHVVLSFVTFSVQMPNMSPIVLKFFWKNEGIESALDSHRKLNTNILCYTLGDWYHKLLLLYTK